MDGTYLYGRHVYLRALEPEDLDFIYEVENRPEHWVMTDFNRALFTLFCPSVLAGYPLRPFCGQATPAGHCPVWESYAYRHDGPVQLPTFACPCRGRHSRPGRNTGAKDMRTRLSVCFVSMPSATCICINWWRMSWWTMRSASASSRSCGFVFLRAAEGMVAVDSVL